MTSVMRELLRRLDTAVSKEDPAAAASRLAEAASYLYKEKYLTHKELVCVLRACVNSVAIANGYAKAYGLPFPRMPRKNP